VRGPRRFTGIRRGLAFMIVVVAAIGYLSTYVIDGLHVCHEELATVGRNAVVRTCGSLPPAALIPVLLIVVGFLWPDLSEFAIPGFFSVRRRVEEQERRQERLEALVRLQQVQSQTTQVQVVLRPDPAVTEEKVERFAEVPQSPLEGTALGAPAPSPRFAELNNKLISIWGELEPLSLASQGSGLWDELSDGQRWVLANWQQVFEDEIQFVRGVRNALYLGPRRVSEQDLAVAVDDGQKLLSLILSKLRHPAFAARRRPKNPASETREAGPGSSESDPNA
jgi:hypothetical protein